MIDVIPETWGNPAIELALLLAFSISGAAALYLIGVRKLWQLIGFAIAVTGLLRVLTYLLLDAAGAGSWAIGLWIAVSVAVFIAASWVGKIDFLRSAASVAAGSGALALVAIAAKYVLDIGERPHTDSSRLVSIAQLILRDGEPLELLDGFFKRGFSYPALLGIAPPERILIALTPFIFLSLVVVMVGWYREARPALRRWQSVLIGIAALAVLSIPMVQISVFYLNGHTLLALALAMVGYGVWRHGEPTIGFERVEPLGYALVLVGVAAASFIRPEGFVLATLVYLPLLARLAPGAGWKERRSAWLPVAVAIVSISAWLYAFDYQNPHRWPIQLWLLALIGLLLLMVWLLPQLDRIRKHVVPIAVGAMVAALGVAAIRDPEPFMGSVRAQAKNLLQGFGEWGLLAPFAVALLLVIGWRGLSKRQQVLMQTTWLLLVGTLASKIVDSGNIGRLGTTDSVNRMWLQLLPILIITLALGLGERRSAKNRAIEVKSSKAADSLRH